MIAWGRVWEVPKLINEHKTEFKLRRWVEINRDAAAGILGTLAAISNLFADAASLQQKYGIKLRHKDSVSYRSEFYMTLFMYKRSRWFAYAEA